MKKLVLVVVSDQRLFREALVSSLSVYSHCEVYGVGSSLIEQEPILSDVAISVVLIDADLRDQKISQVFKLVNKTLGKIVFLGRSSDKKRLIDLTAFKGDGYFTTDLTTEQFFDFLRRTTESSPIVEDSLISEMLNKISGYSAEEPHNIVDGLTPREKEVLELLAVGRNNRQIADELVISIYTVKNHVHNIMAKLEIDNRAKLVAFALTTGLADGIGSR